MRDAQWCRQWRTAQSDARQCILIRPAGYARRTGDAESRELQHLADGQMDSERHADPRCDLRDMSRA
jgi:hypothetical protein